jgi:hypothetical protein
MALTIFRRSGRLRCEICLPLGTAHARNGRWLRTSSRNVPLPANTELVPQYEPEDFGSYRVILPPEPLVWGVSHIVPRPVPVDIRRPAYVGFSRTAEYVSRVQDLTTPYSFHDHSDVAANDSNRNADDVRIPLHGEEERRLRNAARLAKAVREYAGALIQASFDFPPRSVTRAHFSYEHISQVSRRTRSMLPFMSLLSLIRPTRLHCCIPGFLDRVALASTTSWHTVYLTSKEKNCMKHTFSLNHIVSPALL